MNLEICTEAAQFPLWEYFFPMGSGTVSLQCGMKYIFLYYTDPVISSASYELCVNALIFPLKMFQQ